MELRYQRFFFDKHQSLKAHIHKTKSIGVELKMLDSSTCTSKRRFKKLPLRTMAGDALKDEVNDATSIF